ncbi:hypothetical protein ABEU80_19495 [Bacillus velezensis]|uniref:hypothetical protein n=1 Tax=Bacillus velezensis TaxID=492670 RepID=UPI002E23A107|nr:hypothetical protein [Bacillus velezensis]
MDKTKDVKFKRKDYPPAPHILDSIEKVSKHFETKRDYIYEFCGMVQASKRWRVSRRLSDSLKIWKAQFIKDKPNRFEIADIIEDAFLKCTSDDEIDELRGGLLEALLIGIKGGGVSSLNDYQSYLNRGWGAKVYLTADNHTRGIYYECNKKETDGCTNRSTVDYGEWDGKLSNFYECKASPNSISCKEVMYMDFLRSELDKRDIAHNIHFVSAEAKLSVKLKLDSWGAHSSFIPVGYEDLKEMAN